MGAYICACVYEIVARLKESCTSDLVIVNAMTTLFVRTPVAMPTHNSGIFQSAAPILLY